MTSYAPTLDDARRAARDIFGHEDLLPSQRASLRSFLDGHDVLLVSATGSGKSLVYQVAGVLLEGLTVLVSPLVALQQDQVHRLPDDARTRGARVSSAKTPGRRREALERAVAGEVEYLALSPEQLAVDEDIVESPRMREPDAVVAGRDRDDLVLEVERRHDERHQRTRVLQAAQAAQGAGIVYCRTRRAAREVAEGLAARRPFA